MSHISLQSHKIDVIMEEKSLLWVINNLLLLVIHFIQVKMIKIFPAKMIFHMYLGYIQIANIPVRSVEASLLKEEGNNNHSLSKI